MGHRTEVFWGDSSEGPGEGQKGEGDGGVYSLDEFKGGCAGSLRSCSGREGGVVAQVKSRFGGLGGHSESWGCVRESGAQ